MAMHVATVVQVLGTSLALFGDHLIAMLGLPRTPMVQNVLDNKVQILGLSFLFNSVAQSMAKTDAFEVYVNGELVFSKLERKRMPTIDEVYQALADRGVLLPKGQSSGTIKQKQPTETAAQRNRQM
jgi:selT/selW/selH-like putative selenoprotein